MAGKPKDSRATGLICGLSAAVSFGIMNFLVTFSSKEFPITEVAFFRGIFGVIFLIPWGYRYARVLFTRAGWVLWGRSLAGAVSVLCIFLNLQNSSVGDAAALSNLSSLFVVALSWGFMSEVVSKAEWIGISAVISGVFLLQSPFGSSLPGYVMFVGISGAFTASLAYLALRQAAQKFSPNLIVWLFCVTTSILATFAPTVRPWIVPSVEKGWMLLCVIGLLGTLGQILMTHAYVRLPAAVACALSLSSVLWGVVVESAYRWRLPSPGALFSYGVILVGVYVLQTQHRVKTPPAEQG